MITDPDIKAYATATAKYYLHKFGIGEEDIPGWIENTPSCEYLTPFIINALSLVGASKRCSAEFLEKNVLVDACDFIVV